MMFNHYNQFLKNVTKPVYCWRTIHLHSCSQLHIILMKWNNNSGTFRAIAMCISLHLLVICCGGNIIHNNSALYYSAKLHVSLKGLNVMHANKGTLYAYMWLYWGRTFYTAPWEPSTSTISSHAFSFIKMVL